MGDSGLVYCIPRKWSWFSWDWFEMAGGQPTQVEVGPSLASGPCVPMENLYRGWHGSVGLPDNVVGVVFRGMGRHYGARAVEVAVVAAWDGR